MLLQAFQCFLSSTLFVRFEAHESEVYSKSEQDEVLKTLRRYLEAYGSRHSVLRIRQWVKETFKISVDWDINTDRKSFLQ